MKRRPKILIALAGALGAVILVAVVRHYQLRSAADAYIAQLKAEGESMDLASILPPPVPPEKNGGNPFRQAVALLKTNTSFLKTNYDIPSMKMIAPGKAMVGWQQPDVRSESATNSWQEVGAAVAQSTNIFALLRQIVDKPDFDFQIQYRRGIVGLDFPAFGLSDSKEAVLWLSAAAVYHLHAGDTASAVDNARAMLAVAQALRNERFVISELVRIALAQITVGTTWEILQSPTVTDGQLAQIQKDWAKLDFIQSGENALAMERVAGRIDLGTWRASPSAFANYLDKEIAAMASLEPGNEETFWDTISLRPKIFMWKYWWSYPDELRAAKGYQVLIDSLRMVQTNGSFENAMDYQNQQFDELRITNVDYDPFSAEPDFHSYMSQSIVTMQGYIRRIRAAQVAQRAVISAIALKRYQLKHGNLPPTLDALVPEFVPAVPLDPVDGKPLRYRPNRDGTYLLYSVGPNGKDDGGNPAFEENVEGAYVNWLNNHALDWVWPQPATEAEVRDYWAHPPR